MIYSIFIKKMQKDMAPFQISSLIKDYLEHNKNVFILGWPGYISNSAIGIELFKKEIIPSHIKINGFFFKPLKIIKFSDPLDNTGLTQISNIDYMNRIFGGFKCSKISLDDHSKILAFIKFENELKEQDDISIYLNKGNYKVKALLIGSSNQSKHTYCDSPTSKGEADVFMIELNDFKEEDCFVGFAKENYNGKNIIISKQVDKFNTEQTLTDIVEDLLIGE